MRHAWLSRRAAGIQQVGICARHLVREAGPSPASSSPNTAVVSGAMAETNITFHRSPSIEHICKIGKERRYRQQRTTKVRSSASASAASRNLQTTIIIDRTARQRKNYIESRRAFYDRQRVSSTSQSPHWDTLGSNIGTA